MSNTFEKAKEAVENQLHVDDFINERKEEIYAKLEDNHRRAMLVEDDSRGLMFIAESLPLISGIIYVGSTLKNFNDAINWVRKSLPNADPASVLSALTFFYIVEKGWKEFSDKNRRRAEDEKKREMWAHIRKQMDALLIIQGD